MGITHIKLRRAPSGPMVEFDLPTLPIGSTDVVNQSVVPGATVTDALDALATIDKRKSQVVELRFFGGLTVEETAIALEISARTVHTDWAFARARLFRMMREDRGPE